MSEFYKRKRDRIMKDYKYLGMDQKACFWLFRGSAVLFLVIAIRSWFDMAKRGDISKSLGRIGICLLATLISYLLSKASQKKHQEKKMEVIDKFIKEPDININVVQKLIEEIEKYNKKVKVFASWIAGLAATFLVLLITVVTNYIYKMFDMLVSVMPESRLLDEFERELNGEFMQEFIDGKFFVQITETSLIILLLLCMVILSTYFTFSIFTFVKEQILIFLYDVQYKMLSKVSAEHEHMETYSVGESKNE